MNKEDIEKEIAEMCLREEEIRKTDPSFLHYDFQGWPVRKETLRELLKDIGAKEENGLLSFDIDNPILDLYLETMEDDGMGYGGGSEMFFSEANISEDKDGNKHVYFWRDKIYHYAKEFQKNKDEIEFVDLGDIYI